MYSRLNNIVNEHKGFGSSLTDLDIVHKLLRALLDKYETLVTMFLNSYLTRTTPTRLLGTIITHEMFKKKDELLEASSRKKNIAFKAKVASSDESDESYDDDSNEQMALLVRNMRRLMKRRNNENTNFNKSKRGKSLSKNRYSNI